MSVNEFDGSFSIDFDPTQASVGSGPCTWEVIYPGNANDTIYDSMTAEEKAIYESMAATYLWHWTGKAYGTCVVTVRPCKVSDKAPSTWSGRGPTTDYTRTGWYPAVIGGAYYRIYCGTCPQTCLCDSPKSIALPGPVHDIVEVKIDGDVVPATSYRVDNGRFLVRTDGEAWPTTQDQTLASDQEGTFEVTYERGTPVPPGGQLATGVLALELAKAANNDSSCALPQRVQSISRQGITVAVLDAFDDVETGRTGIWLIDSWLTSVAKPPRPARVRSVDVASPTMRRTTWP